MNKLSSTCWDAVHLKARIIGNRFNNNKRSILMHRILVGTLGLLGVVVAVPASAQYYSPGYDGYYVPRPYHRVHPRYYSEYGAPPVYGRGYAAPRYYAGGDLTPQFDPRNGGFFCSDPRFTVQDGICKPYRGY